MNGFLGCVLSMIIEYLKTGCVLFTKATSHLISCVYRAKVYADEVSSRVCRPAAKGNCLIKDCSLLNSGKSRVILKVEI